MVWLNGIGGLSKYFIVVVGLNNCIWFVFLIDGEMFLGCVLLMVCVCVGSYDGVLWCMVRGFCLVGNVVVS